MFDVPEHLWVPVNADGDGPVAVWEADHWACWCKDGVACTEVER
jgi:hypothetical protein